jgi:5-methylcytosine-specific restriction endonuclease McrA
MRNSGVLVLNKSFFPVHVTSVRRAFCLLYTDMARAINSRYEMFDFRSWSELAVHANDEAVGLVGRMIRVPRVVVLTAYDRVPRRNVRFCRRNIFLRDRNTCQYCGRTFGSPELNLDHVVPRSRGGVTTWENIVCSCIACNKRKGGELPGQAGMRLIRRPVRPQWAPQFTFAPRAPVHREWLPFLSLVDFTYWNLELEP